MQIPMSIMRGDNKMKRSFVGSWVMLNTHWRKCSQQKSTIDHTPTGITCAYAILPDPIEIGLYPGKSLAYPIVDK